MHASLASFELCVEPSGCLNSLSQQFVTLVRVRCGGAPGGPVYGGTRRWCALPLWGACYLGPVEVVPPPGCAAQGGLPPVVHLHGHQQVSPGSPMDGRVAYMHACMLQQGILAAAATWPVCICGSAASYSKHSRQMVQQLLLVSNRIPRGAVVGTARMFDQRLQSG
jgi:hypothetical protein